jgi:purine-binding chemotaxis protein CheW
MEDKIISDGSPGIAEEKYVQYLTFVLSDDLYGISVNHIREVDKYGKIFSVPQSPECVKGIINLRGDVIPVVDLNIRLLGKESEITRLTNVVILELDHNGDMIQVGAVIDSVREVVDIEQQNIEAVPGFGLNLRKDFVSGIGKVHNSFVILLDVSTVLNIDEISQVDAGAVKSETLLV